LEDPRKKDLSPTLLNFGKVSFLIPRHFGFCYGVENAIERSYKAIAENPGKRIFLLSQMIHNPDVNKDLLENGLTFLQDTDGKQLISFEELTSDDVVIIPAFGTTLEIENKLLEAGFSKVEARYSYGAPGKIAWRLSMKYPILMLGVSKLFFIILPIYFLLVYPIAFILNYLDAHSNHPTGTGLIVKAWK
jgi:hypothetical protein